MALMSKVKRVEHPKYEVYRCENVNGFIGFRIKLYLIYDCERVYTLYNPSDWIDNVNLMRENGIQLYTFTQDIIVTPIHMHSIYNEIISYVPESNSD